MKKLYIITLLILVGILSACGSSDELSVDDVLTAFEEEGLEVGDVIEMTKDDYGLAPMKADEAKRFLIPSLGEASGGRIFSYSDQKDLEQMKEYYDGLGRESAMLFSWTMSHENILIQINGDLSEEKYNEYKKVLESL